MIRLITAGLLMLVVSACSGDKPAGGEQQSPVSQEPAAAAEPDVEWLSHGLDAAERRFSDLADINADNVSGLQLAWYFDYPTHRGLEATPLMRDGVLYSTGSWSMVYAHNAVTGELLWMHDPKVPPNWAVHLCCDVVNRGVALHGDTVLFGTLDGRLVALEASSGKLLWQVQTTDTERPYSITGAPRIIGDKVIIGNGGAEFGVRGYVSAYDVANGEMLWRFYTVPGNPADPTEGPAMQAALKTWGGGEWWKYGGGGTVWDSMAYDAELNLLYIGVGNGSPWNRQVRSPHGGDNLYLSSIVALNPDDGNYVWHYQTTPGDTWDYTATQHMILADLELDGKTRKVIMQAPKNGFFYVLDRSNGEFISAEPYAHVTWASHIDPETGRPVENAGARYEDGPTDLHFPGPIGAHSWHPMSFNPQTGLVYIPAQEVPWVFETDSNFEYRPGMWNTATDNLIAMAPDDLETKQALLDTIKGRITAWDPVKQEPRWQVEHAGPWNGGILSTAGNLVFQGNATGEFVAYRADSGDRLWAMDAQTGVVAAPMTFRYQGEQYIAVLAGWGGALALVGGEALKGATHPNRSRLLVFKLGGKAELPPAEPIQLTIDPPAQTANAEDVAAGKVLFGQFCMVCHGDGAVSGHVTPDLRALTPETHAQWQAIVLGGMHWQQGMVGFANVLNTEQAEQIHAYVIDRAHHTLKERAALAAP